MVGLTAGGSLQSPGPRQAPCATHTPTHGTLALTPEGEQSTVQTGVPSLPRCWSPSCQGASRKGSCHAHDRCRRPGAQGQMNSFEGTLCFSHEWEGWQWSRLAGGQPPRGRAGQGDRPPSCPKAKLAPSSGWAMEEPVLWVSSSPLLIRTGEKRDYPPLSRVT